MKRSASEVELEDNTATKRRKLEEEEIKISPDAQISQLPKETWLHIIAGRNIMLINSIDHLNIWNFREVSKHFKELIDESTELSWAQLYFRHYGGITDQIRNSSKSWKQIYLEARSDFGKVIEDLEIEEAADLVEYNEEITIEKAEEDHGALWELLNTENEDTLQKFAEHIQKHKYCAMASYYVGDYTKDIHMEVFHMLFEEKYYNAWKRYIEDNDFDQMDVDVLLFEDYLGSEEEGYKVDHIARVLDMADMDDTIQWHFVSFWRNNEENLRSEIEKLGNNELLARIEEIVSKNE